MTKDELREKYHGLYNYMAVSGKPEYMMLAGSIMNDMMDWMIENKPEYAEKWIEKFCAIKWQQYLSKDEAMEIVASMMPPAAWGYDTWVSAMKQLGLEYERDTVFNSYALWVTMNAIHSDNGNVITSLMGLSPNDIGNADYIRAVRSMAVNKLLDADRKFNVRRYFLTK